MREEKPPKGLALDGYVSTVAVTSAAGRARIGAAALTRVFTAAALGAGSTLAATAALAGVTRTAARIASAAISLLSSVAVVGSNLAELLQLAIAPSFGIFYQQMDALHASG